MGNIIDTQVVAVAQQIVSLVERDGGGVSKQGDPGESCEAFADEEVTVTGDKVGWSARVCQLFQRVDDGVTEGIQVIVANPGLKKIPENVERVCLWGYG